MICVLPYPSDFIFIYSLPPSLSLATLASCFSNIPKLLLSQDLCFFPSAAHQHNRWLTSYFRDVNEFFPDYTTKFFNPSFYASEDFSLLYFSPQYLTNILYILLILFIVCLSHYNASFMMSGILFHPILSMINHQCL